MRTREVALVGTGGIAGVHAADIGRLAPRVRVTAAVDPDASRLGEFRERWSVPNTYTDLSTMLDTAPPDLVIVCTPPHRHAGIALACLGRGVHTWCEKPPALSLAELDAVAAAETPDARLITVSQHRFGSGAERLRRMAASGVLGPSMAALCLTLWHRPDSYFDLDWRGRWDTEGGGPTMGHGIHQMDLALSVLGPWREVTAVAARRARPTDTEDFSAALVTLDDGTVVTVVNSLLSPRETSHLRFDFANATVELTHLYGYGDDDWLLTPAEGHAEAVQAAWDAGPAGRPSGHAAQLTAILDALDDGRPPPVTAADARVTLELITAVYASAFTGAPVRRGEIGPRSPFYRRMDGAGAPWPPRRGPR
ncbi:Gfo/Idh/MocA family oxidoreductase [Phytomonospora sp. NPDC050363]|uniref:Gfo/Idh/MocA family protein n=1 Tax=Phytomonospora sp. NPDC050363 TaxID=3155642 RepID=UPI0033DF70CE